LIKSQLEEQKSRKLYDSSQIELQRMKSSNDELLRLLNQEQSIQKTMIDYTDSVKFYQFSFHFQFHFQFHFHIPFMLFF